MINVITLCSGYDSQCMALERLKEKYGLEYDLIAWSEIDKYAIQAHDAIFPQYKDRNIGDMTKADWSKINEKIDLLVYSTPCQSISNAGLQHGFKKDSGTRSSIIWSTLDAIDKLKPKYLLFENVKAIVSKKFIEDFKLWCSALEERGYTNFWKVLNAKDFGIPHNRERVFMVSILNDGQSKIAYEFPEKMVLKKRLKDVLEDKVDEQYYLSAKAIEKITFGYKVSDTGIIYFGDTNKGGERGAILSSDGICSSLTATDYKQPKQIIELIEDTSPETICLNSKLHGKQPSVQNRIYTTNGISTAITVAYRPNIAEPKIIKIGNYSKSCHNASSIVDIEGIAPTVMENHGTVTAVAIPTDQVMQIGNILDEKNWKNPQRGRVYNPEGIAPCLSTMQGGGQEPKILEDKYSPKEYESEIIESINGNAKHQQDMVQSENGICRCIPAGTHGSTPHLLKTLIEHPEGFRIRKLTPRECFRLMGVTESDIDKINNSKISKTQQYKLAGNSIVVDVLEYIIQNIFLK